MTLGVERVFGLPARSILILILLLFVLLGTIYSLVVPPFEASDELWHYPMVWYIAQNASLPVQDPANPGPWRQEGSQPPLYYALAAALTVWIDTSDMQQVRHLNPQVDNGIATPDGNINLVVHHPAREAFPWRGTILAVHLIRFLSVLMGAAGVFLTYRIAREVLPAGPGLALGAAAVHAFTPMLLFISGSVNNDNLVVPLSNLGLLMLIRLAQPPDRAYDSTWGERIPALAGVPVNRYLLLGVVLGLAALTKTSSLALTVLTALVVTLRAVRRRSWAEFLAGGLATLLPLLALSGWWFLRNLRLYGDLTGFSAFFAVLGTRDVPADLAQLWRERYSFLAGYWGNFGGLNVPMPPWAYALLNGVLLFSGFGLFLLGMRYGVSRYASPRAPAPPTTPAGSADPAQGRQNVPLPPIVPLPFLLTVLWGLGVLLPWLGWARVTWSSQGRLIFPAISTWSLLLVLGLAGWFPRRWGRWAAAAFALLLLALAAAAPWAWIAPAYARPAPLTGADVAAIPHPLEAEFGTVMRLLGYDLRPQAAAPGEPVEVTLYWESIAPAERDYTVFVHLLGGGDLSVAQRDTYPGLGLLSTTWLEPGFRWADRYVLTLPETAYAPDAAQVELGLFHAPTEERLPVTGPDGAPLGDNLRFGAVSIRARAGDVPNPIAVNFGERVQLVGYELSEREVHPGQTITLTLYWRGQAAMSTDYTVSAQLVDPGQRKAAQQDSWPPLPTTAWEPDQLVVDTRQLAVYPDAPPGPYDLRVAIYTFDGEQFLHLPVIPEGGRMQADSVILTRVRVW